MRSLLRRLAGRKIPFQTVIDIGASDGKWSLLCHREFPQARILAIEPLREREAALASRKKNNPWFDYSICVAGAEDHSEAMLTVAPDLDGSAVEHGGQGEARSCPVRTLDSLVLEKGLPEPFFLKFDTHGYEAAILEGAGETLKRSSVILMEMYNFKLTDRAQRFEEMIQHLAGLGFRVADLAEPMLRPKDRIFWQADVLFLRADHPFFEDHSFG